MNPRSEEQVLTDGDLTVIGRIRSASNATFLCEAQLGEQQVHCVYKPIAGEAPLWVAVEALRRGLVPAVARIHVAPVVLRHATALYPPAAPAEHACSAGRGRC